MVSVMDIDMLLAAMARCDRRTAAKALRDGADSITVRRVREDVVRAAAELGITLPSAPSGEVPSR